ncbi:hypothetical protein C0J52_10707 [Blattella germanica]|nr:hypothetical protein C0J52_10707 [Blattella germanica]
MKNTSSDKNASDGVKNVECYNKSKDYPLIRRIPFGNSGFRTSASGIGNPKSSFVFSSRNESRDYKPAGTVDCGPRSTNTVNYPENEGSKGDIERKVFSDIDRKVFNKSESPRNLGCDGDVAKSMNPMKYYLCSSGANGDILKPLDENYVRSFENKSFYNKTKEKSTSSSVNTCMKTEVGKSEQKTSSKELVNKTYSSSVPEKKTDFLSFLASLVSNWKGNSNYTDTRNKCAANAVSSISPEEDKYKETMESRINHLNINAPVPCKELTKQSDRSIQTKNTIKEYENESSDASHSRGYVHNKSCDESNVMQISASKTPNELTVNHNKTEVYLVETCINYDRSDTTEHINDQVLEPIKNTYFSNHHDANPSCIEETSCTIDPTKSTVKQDVISHPEENISGSRGNSSKKDSISNEDDSNDSVNGADTAAKYELSLPDTIQNDERNVEKEIIDQYVFEIEGKLAWKKSLSVANLNVKILRPDESFFAKLDSSLKKNTSFVKKLKNFTSSQLEGVLKDIYTLNLNKYLSEVANAIVQAKLKIFDISPAVELCNALHHLYADFSLLLLQSFQRCLSFKEEDEMVICRKLNVDLKFYVELMNVGILSHQDAFPLITVVLTMAVNHDKVEYNNINLLTSFYRHCKEGYAVPRKMRILAEKHQIKLPNYCLLQSEEDHKIKTVLNEYYTSLVERVIKIHYELQSYEKQNKKILQLRGDLGKERKDKSEVLKILKERLWLGASGLAEVLDEVLPDLIEADVDNDELISTSTAGLDEQASDILPWEDKEEQQFYENITDLKLFVPCNLPKSPSVDILNVSSDVSESKTEESEEESLEAKKAEVEIMSNYSSNTKISTEICQLLKNEFKFHIRKKDQINIETKLKIVRFIGELVKFNVYSKIEALYCLKLLLRDFSHHHHIEMFCVLLESCGRYLYRNADSHLQIKVYLEQMMRKKCVTALDSRYVTMIENAFYYVTPPEVTAVKKEQLPPMLEFIEKLLYQDLSKSNIEDILQLLHKVDWENTEVSEFTIECLTMAYHVKYNNIAYLASIVSGLNDEIDAIGIHVVDGVMEDIRLGMEVNTPKYNQRRLAMMKYMGELYKYRVAESNEVFQILYSLISFGVSLSYAQPSDLDPPNHLFRIRLSCVLLETCGKYFIGGTNCKKLDYFLIYFQRYFWFKYEDPYWKTADNIFPVGIRYLFEDTLLTICPKIHLFLNFEEANKAVQELQNKLASKHNYYAPLLFSPNNDIVPSSKIDLLSIVEEESEECMEESSGTVSNESHKCYGVHGNISVPEMFESSQSQTLDDEFVSAFDKMVSENIQNRKSEMVKPQVVDFSVPIDIKNNSKKTYKKLQQTDLEDKSVNFVLLMKKGHKQHCKNLNMPIDSELALNLMTGKEAERAEKERVKQLTLDMNQRLEEESYLEMLSQSQKATTAVVHQSERKYSNQRRGTTYAELFFGSKKAR